MKHYASTLNLKDDPALIEQYKEYHRAVWPEVQESLRAIGITRMDIYLLGRRLFMAMETVDDFVPDEAFARYLTLSPRCSEWEELMDQFQEKVPEAKAHEKWAQMENIFELS